MSISKIFKYAVQEKERQEKTLSLIASENLIYPECLEVASLPLTNKYSEGYPGRRFYAGCENIDLIEQETIELAKQLFNSKFANVQAYSGSIANFAIYKALLNPGDSILSMEMSSGGHLTHSSSLSFVSLFYKVFTYSVEQEDWKLNYDKIRELALKIKPKLIIAGSSSYPFKINFQKFREIADLVGAYLLADICHLSSLIVAGFHQHCFPYAHVAMCTTHKQLRGARGALILWNDESLSSLINKSLFPGLQGGMNPSVVAMNGIALAKNLEPSFKDYVSRVVNISKIMCQRFKELGAEVIGTETHMMLIDVKKSFGLTGKEATVLLEQAGLIVNQNLTPFDNESPLITSGIRIGSLTLASLNFSDEESIFIADNIFRILNTKSEKETKIVRSEIEKLLNGKKR